MSDKTTVPSGVLLKQPPDTAGCAVERLRRKPQWKSRAFWLRQMRQWHWISAAISLVGMLLFAATGITLNHASQIGSKPRIVQKEANLPAGVRQQLQPPAVHGRLPVPAAVSDWLSANVGVNVRGLEAEWTGKEAYIGLPRPGGDAWLTIDAASGDVAYEDTDRGWIAYLNDLHKGRNAGLAWSLFLDAFAVACVLFCLTGLVLLHLNAVGRPSTWPIVAAGLVIPVILLLIFVH
jgi:hypothetical protein